MPEACGLSYRCPNDATLSITSPQGGYFGKICDDCADSLNRYLERMMEINQMARDGTLPKGTRLPTMSRY